MIEKLPTFSGAVQESWITVGLLGAALRPVGLPGAMASLSRMVMVCAGDRSTPSATVNTMVSALSASWSSMMPIVKEGSATQTVPAALGENAEGRTVAKSTPVAPPKLRPGGGV